MKILKYFVFSLIYFSSVFGVDDNTLLPTPDTLATRQQKIQFALAKSKHAFITKISQLHIASTDIPSLQTSPPSALGRVIPQTYFNTSDMRIVNYYIEKILHYSLQPDSGTGNPPHVTVESKALNAITVKCNLRTSGDLVGYFESIGGIGYNPIPDAGHPTGGLTDWVLVVIQKKKLGWEIASAYPVDYN
jgi:hypothetical protein